MKTMYRNAIIQRIGERTNQGICTQTLTTNIRVTYNKNNPNPQNTLVDTFAQWAQTHGGRVLLPFSGNHSINRLDECDTYIGITPDNTWISGDIAACGTPWNAATTRVDGYTVPDNYRGERQRYWLALDNVRTGTDFDYDNWVATGSQNSVNQDSLRAVWDASKSPSMYAIGSFRED